MARQAGWPTLRMLRRCQRRRRECSGVSVMRVFITGASGFIGRALRERYAARGHEVAGATSSPTRSGVVAGDVGEPGPWQEALAGSDLVIHTAATVSLRTERPSEVWRANVLGTRHVVDACERGGRRPARALLVGHRVRVRVPRRRRRAPSGAVDERPVPGLEDRLRAGRAPGARRGPGHARRSSARATSTARARAPGRSSRRSSSATRRFTLPGGGRGIFSPVYIENLIDGVVAAGESPAAAGRGVHPLRRGRGAEPGVLRAVRRARRPAAAHAPDAGGARRRGGRPAGRPPAPGRQRHQPRVGALPAAPRHLLERRRRGGCSAGSRGSGSARGWSAPSSGCATEGYGGAGSGSRGRAGLSCAPSCTGRGTRRRPPRAAAAAAPASRGGAGAAEQLRVALRPLVQPVDVGLPGEADPAVGLDRAGGDLAPGPGRGGGGERRALGQPLRVGVGRPGGEVAPSSGRSRCRAASARSGARRPGRSRPRTPNCLRSLTYSSVISSARWQTPSVSAASTIRIRSAAPAPSGVPSASASVP